VLFLEWAADAVWAKIWACPVLLLSTWLLRCRVRKMSFGYYCSVKISPLGSTPCIGREMPIRRLKATPGRKHHSAAAIWQREEHSANSDLSSQRSIRIRAEELAWGRHFVAAWR